MHRKILIFSLIALLISLFLEITLFNYTHYATLFTSKQFSILPDTKSNNLEFKDLNTEIASIHIEPAFKLNRIIRQVGEGDLLYYLLCSFQNWKQLLNLARILGINLRKILQMQAS